MSAYRVVPVLVFWPVSGKLSIGKKDQSFVALPLLEVKAMNPILGLLLFALLIAVARWLFCDWVYKGC